MITTTPLSSCVLVAVCALSAPALASPTVDIQLLSISDWHAQLTPIGQPARGGAAALAAYFAADRAANPNTLTLTAGDAFGASPPISSYFDDVPAVEALELMGLDADTFGNHNFDDGITYLQNLVDLASYDFVSANLANLSDNLSGVRRHQIYDVGGIKVGVVGITNPDAPTLVKPGSLGTIQITNPVAAAMLAREQMREDGAQVFVAIVHMGVTGGTAAAPTGPLVDFANGVSGFDVILGDHTDWAFNGDINGARVVENLSKGATYARVRVTWNKALKRVASTSAEIVVPLVSGVTPDPVVAALVENYRQQLAPILSGVIGSSSVRIPRTDLCGNANGRTCESFVGDLVTDAMRVTYGTDFAITNSGGLRAALTCPETDSPSDFCPAYVPPPYPITTGQVIGVLPFGNEVVTLSVSGAELKAALEGAVSLMPAVEGRFPQVSGFCFEYDISAAAGSRVYDVVHQAADGSCSGPAVDLTAASTYTLAENDFMVAGGDGYPNWFARATSRDLMDQVLADYLTAVGTVSPARQDRVLCTSSGATACPTFLP